MSRQGDRRVGRWRNGELDADFDMLLDGVVVDPRLVRLAGLADDVRAIADGPPPGRSAELTAVLSGRDVHRDEDLTLGAGRATSIARRCLPDAGRARPRRRGDAGLLRRIGAMGMVAKLGIGLGLVGAGAVAAGAGGVLPDPATSAICDAIEAVTPFHLPDSGASDISDADDTGAPPNRTANDDPAEAASTDAESAAGDVVSRQDPDLTEPRGAALGPAGRPVDDVSATQASGDQSESSGGGPPATVPAAVPAPPPHGVPGPSPGTGPPAASRSPSHPGPPPAATPSAAASRRQAPLELPADTASGTATTAAPAPSGGPPVGAPAGDRPGPAPADAVPPAQPPGAPMWSS